MTNAGAAHGVTASIRKREIVEPKTNPFENKTRLPALDRKYGMTFGELRKFVQEAMRSDTPDSNVVRIESTWRQSIKVIEVDNQP